MNDLTVKETSYYFDGLVCETVGEVYFLKRKNLGVIYFSASEKQNTTMASQGYLWQLNLNFEINKNN